MKEASKSQNSETVAKSYTFVLKSKGIRKGTFLKKDSEFKFYYFIQRFSFMFYVAPHVPVFYYFYFCFRAQNQKKI